MPHSPTSRENRRARASNMRWLMSLAHMEPSPVSRWVALRAALAIGLPTAAGLLLDQSAPPNTVVPMDSARLR